MVQGLTASISAYVCAATGLPASEGRVIVDVLKQAGQRLPDPTREEVDGFLAEQDFRVRHEANLTESKRQSILSRIRDGIGRAMPDGGTFLAWRTALSAAWVRSRRAIGLGATSVALAAGLAACGTSTPAERPAQPPTATASATASPASQVRIEPLTATGEAGSVFGESRVQVAYAEMADYTSRVSFNPALMRSATPSPADFAGPRERMTPYLQAQWDASVAAARGGDKAAHDNLMGVAYYGVEDEKDRLATTGPVVTNESITNPQVSVDKNKEGQQRLGISFSHHGEIRVTEQGQAERLPVTKTISYHLVPAPAGSTYTWLIDGVTATYHSGDPIPESTR